MKAKHTAPAVPVDAQPIYVEVRECSGCGHIGINDSPSDICACNTCGWVGPYQKEDHCPECKRDGTMTSACPECRDHRTSLLVDADLPLPAAPVLAAQPEQDKPQEAGQARELPPHNPTIAIEEILDEYDGDARQDVWESIQAYADIRARSAIAQAAPAVPEGWMHTIMRAAECLEILNERPRPMCRDCADENGICPNGGLDCDMRKLIADVRAIAAAINKSRGAA